MKLAAATRNRHKLAELDALVAGLEVELLPSRLEVEETGASFEDNAVLKARAVAAASGHWALGDDSGLEVDALGGAPGVHSARYAGQPCDDAANNAKLLAALREVPAEKRSARFRCVLALASPEGELHTASGVCEGRIGWAPRGSGGFGYDPLFEVAGQGGRTMAELLLEEKNRLSHRARALAALRPLLAALVARE
ncbi:MAG TPA: RdgB/HAM1 family non-canonical purine NTP pyrophosphatase [Polyangia bacterium]|nr:RdgB/HAM1 family non-canonical purine NTP pyrophosphatase [Polyangia bacterium]